MMHKAWCNVEEVPYNFFEVIHQISRWHGLKNRRFESNLSKIITPIAAIKSQNKEHDRCFKRHSKLIYTVEPLNDTIVFSEGREIMFLFQIWNFEAHIRDKNI